MMVVGGQWSVKTKDQGHGAVNPHCLIDGEEEMIARRLREELGR